MAIYVAVILCFLGTFLAFANPLFRLPVLVLLVPASLAYLGFKAKSGKNAFKLGWVAGILANTAALYWIALPPMNYGGIPWYLSIFCPLLISLILGLYFGLYSLFIYFSRKLPVLALGLFCGLAWVGLEHLRGTLFSGFPWLNLATAFAPWPWAIQAASLMGAYALSGLFAASACWISLPGRNIYSILSGFLLLAGVTAYGLYALELPVPEGKNLSVSVIQGSFDQSIKWEKSMQSNIFRTYLEESQAEFMENSPKLIIWPETALPFFLQLNAEYSEALDRFTKDLGVAVLTGVPAFGYDSNGQRHNLNRALLVSPTGAKTYYDKAHLVPFGEYVPFADYLPAFETKIFQGVGDFMPGEAGKNLYYDGIALGVLICYEVIFPELASLGVQNGAQVFITISNDAWFDHSSAPRQHLELAALRAVEQKRYIVRATNTGFSAFIDPKGRIENESKLFTKERLHGNVVAIDERTPFSLFENTLNWILFFAGLLLLIWSQLIRDKRYSFSKYR